MNSTIEQLEPYAELETAVRQAMNQLCSETCGMCTACCCRADICEEVPQSAFLSMLLDRQGLSKADMDDRYGWLDLQGCSLEVGRPPICYAYFCDQLLARLPDDDARHVAQVLGRLMHHVGQDALGDWHLVEIWDAADLEKVDFNAVSERMEEAQAALEAIGEWAETGRLGKVEHEMLNAIPVDDL